MNDNHLSSDDVLQFAFGELNAVRQAAVQKAVAEDAELAATAKGLAAAVAVLRAENIGQVSGDFNDRLRRRMPEVLDAMSAEATRTTSLARRSPNWRLTMRSRICRVAAAAVFALAIAGVVFWFHGDGATLVLADFLRPIIEAKTARFKKIQETAGEPTTASRVMWMAPNQTREEFSDESGLRMVTIFDWKKGKSLALAIAEKRAMIHDLKMPPGHVSKDWFTRWRSRLLDDRGDPDFQSQPLGTKEIDGRHAVGYCLTGHGQVINLWGDPTTGLPISVEMTDPMYPKAKLTMSNFEFNIDFDESLFSVEPPAGYATTHIVEKSAGHVSDENDLIEMFRCYSELNGGAFKDKLDADGVATVLFNKFKTKLGLGKGEKLNERAEQEMSDVSAQLFRGIGFATRLPLESDAHYAGKGVLFGAADKPIFWYRLKDSKKYRVIYADLTVHDADTPPNVPNAQPVPKAAKPKK
jgi:outer membrane lipoprotein-sorting protein